MQKSLDTAETCKVLARWQEVSITFLASWTVALPELGPCESRVRSTSV